jgi:hypothetical protein
VSTVCELQFGFGQAVWSKPGKSGVLYSLTGPVRIGVLQSATANLARILDPLVEPGLRLRF